MSNQDKALKRKIKEEAQKRQMLEMYKSAEDAKSLVEKEVKKWYNDYVHYAEAKDYKRANRALKMFLFMQKLYEFGKDYVDMLNAQKAITEMIGVVKTTNKSFANVLKLSKSGITRGVVRNFRKFTRGMNRLGANIDKMMSAMDSIFEGKKKKKKGSQLSDEELFNQTLTENIKSVNSYESAQGLDASTSAASPATAKKSGGTTTGFGGIGDPD